MMKLFRNLSIAAFALVIGFLVFSGLTTLPTIAQNVACYMTQGGAAWTAGSGCTLTIASGGTFAAASGSTVTMLGNSAMVARGATALDGSNPTYVTTGLTTITSCAATVKGTAAPTDASSTTFLSWSGSTGQLILYAFRPTSANSSSLVASTATETIGWVCVGA